MSDLLGTLGSVIGVLDDLNARQSCVVTVVNESAETLTLAHHEAAHGDFVTLPARHIPPGASDTFATADRQIAVLTGTEATCVYDVGGKAQWTIHWDNPGDIVESNGADTKLEPNTGELHVESDMAGGNEKVPVRFVITGPGGGGKGGGTTPPVPPPAPPVPPPAPPQTDTPSSCVIAVANHTNVTLTLFDQGHNYGEFMTNPPIEIPAGGTAQFVSTETQGSVQEGCAGFVAYSFGPTSSSSWTLRWNNPEGADNATDATLFGPDSASVHSIDQIGAGNENVPVTFTLTGQVGAVVPTPVPPTPVPPTPVPPVPPVPPEPEPEYEPPADETGEPTLRQGDKSVDGWVEYLQEALNTAGFGPLTVDGDFGSGTHRQVIAYQQARGLQVDGTVGNQTWASLRGETPQDPSTDGRDPHTYVERGPEARWMDETDPIQPTDDFVQIFAVSTGDQPLSSGDYRAVARITVPSGEQHVIELDLDTFGEPTPEGGLCAFGATTDLFRTPGDYTIEAYMPSELGGDQMTQQVTIPEH